MKSIRVGILAALLVGCAFAPVAVRAAEVKKLTPEDAAAADKVWKELQSASRPPNPPAEWSTKAPTPEDRAAFEKEVGKAASAAAAKAKEFYTRFPNHVRVQDAQQREKKLLQIAAQYGQEDATQKLADNPQVSAAEKLGQRMNQVHANAAKKQTNGVEAVIAEFEKGIRELARDYPDNPEVASQFMIIAKNSKPEKAREIYAEVLKGKASDEVKAEARKQLKVLGAVGQPFEMEFTAVDGRKVNVQEMKGKVVLIDFWATWCGPCVAELPKVKKIYNELHEKGFEIIGISFDKQKAGLMEFVDKQQMDWPQYFDGKGWGTKYGVEYEISSIPTMWLVDKKGNLRDLNARQDLEQKVKDLLAEK